MKTKIFEDSAFVTPYSREEIISDLLNEYGKGILSRVVFDISKYYDQVEGVVQITIGHRQFNLKIAGWFSKPIGNIDETKSVEENLGNMLDYIDKESQWADLHLRIASRAISSYAQAKEIIDQNKSQLYPWGVTKVSFQGDSQYGSVYAILDIDLKRCIIGGESFKFSEGSRMLYLYFNLSHSQIYDQECVDVLQKMLNDNIENFIEWQKIYRVFQEYVTWVGKFELIDGGVSITKLSDWNFGKSMGRLYERLKTYGVLSFDNLDELRMILAMLSD